MPNIAIGCVLVQGVLCALPNADSFIALVGDYISSANRNFSRPVWGQRELDLYTVSGQQSKGTISLCEPDCL